MKNVNYLIGNEEIIRNPLEPYSDEAVSFVDELSKKLMKKPETRLYSDIAAFAFWCRRSNIKKYMDGCPDRKYRLGRGLCFHIAPGNIPVNFAFTYVFGILAGCSNIVRIPSKPFPQVEIIISAINELLNDFIEIKKRTAFVSYPSENEATSFFSQLADVRVIWGGNDTIEKIKCIKSKPRCLDVAFADRYSICVINAEEIISLNDIEKERLAEDFYNDTYLMDQNACSSPKVIFWINDSEKARCIFWESVKKVAQEKYNLQDAVAVEKYMHICRDAIDFDNVSKFSHDGNILYTIELNSIEEDITTMRGNGGYFYEYPLQNIEELCKIVDERYQTLTYFGIEPESVRNMVIANRLNGIDRIVPIGKALDIGLIWDGFDLVRTMSRIVNVE